MAGSDVLISDGRKQFWHSSDAAVETGNTINASTNEKLKNARPKCPNPKSCNNAKPRQISIESMNEMNSLHKSSWIDPLRFTLATNNISNSTDDYYLTHLCSLCYDRSLPLYPNTTVDSNNNLTCSSLDLGLKSFMLLSNPVCAVAQDYYANLCGCPRAPRCSGVCLDGAIPKYNRTFPISLNDEGTYNVSCIVADAILKNISENSAYCPIATMTSKYCGCTVYAATCTPCYGNDPIPNWTQTFVYGNEPGKNCGTNYLDSVLADYNNFPIYGGSCDVRQLFGAIQCDCPKLPPTYNNGCRLCPLSQTLNTSTSAVVQVYNTTMKCKELSVYLNIDSTCNAQRNLDSKIIAACCIQGKSTSSMTRVSWILGLVLLLTSSFILF